MSYLKENILKTKKGDFPPPPFFRVFNSERESRHTSEAIPHQSLNMSLSLEWKTYPFTPLFLSLPVVFRLKQSSVGSSFVATWGSGP